MPKSFPWSDDEIDRRVREAVRAYWKSRIGQAAEQKERGVADTGSRSEVTGGKHFGAFTTVICELANEAGYKPDEIRFGRGVDLPGFYRPAKKWDVIVVRGNRLCAAIELKSHVGPSFGNNYNNRTEEALGNSHDLWRAFEENLLGSHSPWVGYLLLLEQAGKSTRPVKISKTYFAPDRVFPRTSYAQRYCILCQRMIQKRDYNAATLLTAPRGNDGTYSEPCDDLRISNWLRQMYGHLIGSS